MQCKGIRGDLSSDSPRILLRLKHLPTECITRRFNSAIHTYFFFWRVNKAFSYISSCSIFFQECGCKLTYKDFPEVSACLRYFPLGRSTLILLTNFQISNAGSSVPAWTYGFLVEIRAQLSAATFAFHRNQVISHVVHFVLQDGCWLHLEQEGAQQNLRAPVLHRNKKPQRICWSQQGNGSILSLDRKSVV